MQGCLKGIEKHSQELQARVLSATCVEMRGRQEPAHQPPETPALTVPYDFLRQETNKEKLQPNIFLKINYALFTRI